MPPSPLRIFHITAIANLPGIAAQKEICAKSMLAQKQQAYSNIAYQGAQGVRASKQVPRPPGGVIHDYVPFYFAPRSPMLFTINNGNVEGCDHRQQDIVHFTTTVEAISQAGLQTVFYNYNATRAFAECFNQLQDLDKIDWPLFFEAPRLDGYCKYWHSTAEKPKYILRMETRQAEFLVHQQVPLSVFTEVGVYDQIAAQKTAQVFANADVRIPVYAKPSWYF